MLFRSSIYGVSCSAGTLTINNNITGGTAAGGSAHGVNLTSSGALNVTGNVVSSATGGGIGVNSTSTGAITVTGNISANATKGVATSSSGSITVTGNVTASATGYGIYSSYAGGTITVTGIMTAVSSFPAIYCNGGGAGARVNVHGDMIGEATSGYPAVSTLGPICVDPTLNMTIKYATDTGGGGIGTLRQFTSSGGVFASGGGRPIFGR